MRILILMLLVVKSIGTACANEIDSLKTKEDVQDFLSVKFSKQGLICADQFFDLTHAERNRLDYLEYQHQLTLPDTIEVLNPETGKTILTTISHDSATNPFRPLPEISTTYSFTETDSIMRKNAWHFYKADIDGNGLTDLIVDAGTTLVVVDMGNKYEGHTFSLDSNVFRFLSLTSLPDGTTGLLFRHGPCNSHTLHKKLYNSIDTLVYKFHGFAKYNSHFKPLGITKLCYHYTCDVYGPAANGSSCMEIDSNGDCYLQHARYDSTFSAKLDSKTLNELWNLVSYADVKQKKDDYLVNIVDYMIGGTLAVYFSDGSVKKISTITASPPIGVGYVGRNIADISRVLHWQPSKPHPGFVCVWGFESGDAESPDADPDDCDCIELQHW